MPCEVYISYSCGRKVCAGVYGLEAGASSSTEVDKCYRDMNDDPLVSLERRLTSRVGMATQVLLRLAPDIFGMLKPDIFYRGRYFSLIMYSLHFDQGVFECHFQFYHTLNSWTSAILIRGLHKRLTN